MTIAQTVEQYIQHKRSLGMKFDSPAVILRSFARAAGDAMPDDFDAEQVHAFLFGCGTSAQTAIQKWSTLRGLYRFALARGIATTSPLPVRMPRVSETLMPHIYDADELRYLLQTVVHLPLSKLQPHTVQAMLLVLYGAALRIGEAVRLVISDVDFVNMLLKIRVSKFYKDRLVPIGGDLAPVLQSYAATRQCLGHSDEDSAPFFVSDAGDRITIQLAEQAFRRLRELAKVNREDGGHFQPCLHGLRHSFAVHRLVEWYKAGSDVNLMLPKLSTFLGHLQVSYTQRYLTMTPELLQEASSRFETFAKPEGSHE
jgi:site-specific recombinase XerD